MSRVKKSLVKFIWCKDGQVLFEHLVLGENGTGYEKSRTYRPSRNRLEHFAAVATRVQSSSPAGDWDMRLWPDGWMMFSKSVGDLFRQMEQKGLIIYPKGSSGCGPISVRVVGPVTAKWIW